MTRVRPLLMNQLGNGQATLSQGLLLMQDYFNNPAHVSNPHPPSYYFYGAGGAPYYGPAAGMDINTIWNSADFNADSFAVNELTGDIVYCATFGLKRVAYEGGPQLGSDSLSAQVWRDDRLARTMIDHHNTWSNYGGDLFVYFTVDNWGSSDNKWSFIHTIEDPNTPKMRAIDSLNAAQRAPITIGKTVPGSYAGTNSDIAAFNGSSFVQSPGWRSYVIRVDRAGTYGVTVHVSNIQSGTVAVLMDGVQIGSTAPSASGTTPKCTAALTPGLHGVMVRATSGAFAIDTVNVSVESLSRTVDDAMVTQRTAGRPTICAAGGRVCLRNSGPATNYALCTIQGRNLASGLLSESAKAQPVALKAKMSRGVYLLHASDGSSAGALVR
jgi:hypothetical protein